MVRGEIVEVVREFVSHEVKKTSAVLGAVVPEATMLVSYPDGEMGYIKPDEFREAVEDGDSGSG